MRRASIGFVLALLPFAAHSQYEQDFGTVVAHYSALPTERLLPAMAKSYGIVRSRDRGLVNVAVERKGSENATIPVRATLNGRAVSVSGADDRAQVPRARRRRHGLVHQRVSGQRAGHLPLHDSDHAGKRDLAVHAEIHAGFRRRLSLTAKPTRR